jgi:hypothetical protein
MPQSVGLGPVLQLQQFDLEDVFLLFVVRSGHSMVIGIVLPPGIHRDAAGIEQDRIVVLVVDNGVAIQVYLHARTLTLVDGPGVTDR